MPACGCPPVMPRPLNNCPAAWLQGATAPVALAMHVYDVLRDAVKGPGGGCNTEMYVALRMHKLLESTLWLIAGRLNVYWLKFNRNAVDTSGSTGRWRARVQSTQRVSCFHGLCTTPAAVSRPCLCCRVFVE